MYLAVIKLVHPILEAFLLCCATVSAPSHTVSVPGSIKTVSAAPLFVEFQAAGIIGCCSGGRYETVCDFSQVDMSPECTELDTNGDRVIDMRDDMYSPYYPGDDVVDWVGMSLYHFGAVGVHHHMTALPECSHVTHGAQKLFECRYCSAHSIHLKDPNRVCISHDKATDSLMPCCRCIPGDRTTFQSQRNTRQRSVGIMLIHVHHWQLHVVLDMSGCTPAIGQ